MKTFSHNLRNHLYLVSENVKGKIHAIQKSVAGTEHRVFSLDQGNSQHNSTECTGANISDSYALENHIFS